MDDQNQPQATPGAPRDGGAEVNLTLGPTGDPLLLGQIVDGIPVMVALIDIDYRYRFTNCAYSSWFGLAPHEMPGRSLRETLGEERFSEVEPRVAATLRGETTVFEDEISSPNGRRSIVRVNHLPHRGPDGSIDGLIVIGEEITEQRRLEGELRRSQRLESMGRLAGGIAHDFSNILQAIQSHAEVAGAETDRDSIDEHLSGIRQSAGRARQLVRQLLAFGRRQVLMPRRLDLADQVDDTLSMVRRILGGDITVEHRRREPCGSVLADAGQLEQVLVNLCVNARDAMPSGGTIVVETTGVRADGDFCRAHAWAQPGHYSRLKVHDHDTGMDEEVAERIFDPFFSTKPAGQGTGLGLATVYGIVMQHDGMIFVDTKPDEGSCFTIYLRCVGGTPEATRTRPTAHADLRGSGTILLAEDEPSVRTLSTQVLERAGYRVMVAEDGREALDLLERHVDQIQLAVLDLMMPITRGDEVFARIRSTYPDVRVIFTSGYSLDEIPGDRDLGADAVLLQKPFGIRDLLSAVRRTLDGDTTGDDRE